MSEKFGGLAVFDLDGTLLRGLTVCELLAEPLGRRDRMRELERFRSLDELAAARAEMATWYQTTSHSNLIASLQNATLAPEAKAGLTLLRRCGIAVAIASVTWNFAVKYFARVLGVPYFVGTGLNKNGQIDHIWPRDKAV